MRQCIIANNNHDVSETILDGSHDNVTGNHLTPMPDYISDLADITAECLK